MQSILTYRVILLGLVFLLPSSLALAQVQKADIDTAKRYLVENHEALGLTPEVDEDLVLTSQHVSTPTGITHLYFQQQIDGVPVYNAIVNVAVSRDGRVIRANSTAVAGLERTFRQAAQGLSPEAAVEAAARELGLEVTEPIERKITTQRQEGPFERVFLTGGGIASEDILAQLVYLPTEYGGLRLTWVLEFYAEEGNHLWHLGIDAASGEMLVKQDLTVEDHFHADDYWPEGWERTVPADAHQAASAAPVPFAPIATRSSPLPAASGSSSASGSYRVYDYPYESPSHAGDPFADLRTLVSNRADRTASPLGWHDTGTTQYTITRGNNVHAGVDVVPPNGIDPGGEAEGGPGLVFDFVFDPSDQNPEDYRDAAVTNLFYWNNLIHDVTYHYGFDEPSGNFQVNNFGRGGLGNDDVRAEAQDYSGTNNANFSTPRDGLRPRMQMYVWNSPFVNELAVGAPVNDAYSMSGAAFGPRYPVAGISSTLVLVDDGTASPSEGCSPLVNGEDVGGNIAVVYRGSCTFVTKVLNAQNAGAVAVVVVNNAPGNPTTLGGVPGPADPEIVIPSGMISQDNGATVVAALPGVSATARNLGSSALNRDSDFDNGIIVHEYAHGISNRLTGGPNNVSCLPTSGTIGGVPFTSEQMGEGWSDYYALLLTDTNTEDRGIGTYVTYAPSSGNGIRPYPYSRSFAVNPATYDYIKTAAAPHGVGFVWGTMLWDFTRDLVDRHGFNPNIYQDYTTGGNNLALLLVTEGLKLQGCYPGFVDGRDAILAADAAITGGANQCLAWDAFAKRGLGFSADQGSFFDRADGTEAFDLPVSCATFAMVKEQVEALLAAGVLNRGQARSMLVKLENAEKRVNEGKPSVALSLLNAFINQVNDLESEGVLTAEQAEVLIAHAEGLTSRIQEFYPDATSGAVASSEALGADMLVDMSSAGVPDEFVLEGAYPNPSVSKATFRFGLAESSHVTLTVYDIVGRSVTVLVDAERQAGWYEVALDGSSFPSGTYFVRMATSGGFHQTKNFTIVR